MASSLTRYRAIAKIASGGMATVTLAEDTVLGRHVALKRMTGTVSRSGVSRLRREALVGASVSHPNLVSVYDVVAEDGDVVIVMEYVEGRTLKDALALPGRLAPKEAIRILRGVASALDAIHARGIVHRDVKPPNILLGRDGEVKLADLGIAAAPDRTSITTEGSLVGSFSYMAPEQLGAGPAAPAMDVYALSAVAFEALSGQRARREDNPLALAHAIATRPPPDLSAVWPEAPPAVSELLKRGMSKDPAQRPGSAGELVRGLESALGPLLAAGEATTQVSPAAAIQTARPSRPRSTRRPGASSRPGRTAPAARRPQRAAGAAAAGVAAGAAGAAAAGAGGAAAAGAATREPGQPVAPKPAQSAAPPATPDPPRTPAGESAVPGPRTPPPADSQGNRSRRRAGWLAPVLLGLVALAVLAAVLSSGGSPHRNTASRSAKTHTSSTHARTKKPAAKHHTRSTSQATTPQAAGTQGTTSPPTSASIDSSTPASGAPSGNGNPVSAVERFYGLAAGHQFQSAWALADPTFRNQLEGYDSFVAGQEGDRKIIFKSAQVTSQSPNASTVAIRTTSIRNDGTHQCSGTVNLVPGGGGWLLHQIDINC